MVCQFQVYSKVIQLYIHIYLFFFRFFSHIGYYRVLNRVPCAIQQVLVDYLFYFILFFGCVASLLLHAGFLQLRRAGAALRCGARASHCGGFSLWSTGPRHMGFSSCGLQALEHRLSSCGTWAQLLRGMWDLPGAGLEPVSPALARGFLTTAPPGKSLYFMYSSVYMLILTS